MGWYCGMRPTQNIDFLLYSFKKNATNYEARLEPYNSKIFDKSKYFFWYMDILHNNINIVYKKNIA